MSKQVDYSRVVNVMGTIDEKLASEFIEDILAIVEKDKEVMEYNESIMRQYNSDVAPVNLEPMTINIMSYGGSVESYRAMIDVLEQSITPIHTHCLGYAMSSALGLYLRGDIRTAGRRAIFMLHKTLGGSKGTTLECESVLKYHKYLEDLYFDDVLKKTTLSPADIDKCRLYNLYFDYREALDIGIINKDIHNLKSNNENDELLEILNEGEKFKYGNHADYSNYR